MNLRRTRIPLAALVLSLLATAAPAASLARLADAFVAELLRSAPDAPVEMGVPEDHTGTAVALDLHALVLARLRARTTTPGATPVRADAVVGFEGSRLVVTARLTRDGQLLDVVSVSVDRAEGALPLARQPAPATGTALDVLGSELSPPLPAPVVALAFLGDSSRLLVLAPAELLLYRRDGGALQLEARAPLPVAVAARRPGGRLHVAGDVVSAWTSLCPEGRRFRVAAGALRDTGVPPAPPLRFLAGTNVLEGEGGRFLAHEGGVAVDEAGVLRAGPAVGPRAGAALAVPWPEVAVTPAATAPGAPDELQVSFLDEAIGVDGRIPVPGDVRALASLRSGARATLAVALRSAGVDQLLLLEVGRPVLEGEP